MDLTWRQVAHGEEIGATVYEFRPTNNALITLTKMSLRDSRSVTTNASAPQATQFRDRLLRHHGACIVSGEQIEVILAASHLIPRRLMLEYNPPYNASLVCLL